MFMNNEKTIFELSVPGRKGFQFPDADVPETELPAGLVRETLPMPELSELDVVRHYTRLSRLNYSVDSGFYPLGSCTMKYNPKVCEKVAVSAGFSQIHPLQPIETVQGALVILYEMQTILSEIGGMAAGSLTPAAGAQSEFCGIKMIAACLRARGQTQRKVMLIPDSAHGTNPASSVMSGFECRPVRTNERGNIDLDDLSQHLNDQLAGIMITNPNTLGLFDENILEVTKRVHDAGGLVYGDGANMNALLGIVKPASLGIDVMHYNLHKTFGTPHGGGGPGAGAVCCVAELADYLPGPIAAIIEEGEDGEPPLYGLIQPKKSIGMVRAFWGHFAIILRAYAYCMMLGRSGLREVGETATLNANYLMHALKGLYPLPYDRTCMHEFVLDVKWKDAPEIRAFDVAKRMMDYGLHPPTYYFPLIVHEALMIEPTETESKETLDAFIDVMRRIAEEARTNPALLTGAPKETPFGRLDEVRAAKDLKIVA